MAKKATQLTNEGNSSDREHLLSNSFYALPDNPSNKNFTASQIKGKGYKPSLIIFDWLRRLVDEVNGSFSETDSDLSDLNSEIDRIKDGRTTAYKADKDGDGNVISSHYETKHDASDKLQNAKSYTDERSASVLAQANAYSDESETDAIASSKDYVDTEYDARIRNHVSNRISESSVEDKEYALNTAISKSDTAEQNAKAYADSSKIAKSSINDTLTSDRTDEVLSAKQGKELKGMIDEINRILSSDDADLDTIREIVEFIKNNKDVIDTISTTKINYTDIIDNYDSQTSDRPLSANVGRVLKQEIDAKANSSDVYAKTATYSRDEIDVKLFGSGLMTVEDYDQSTGLITIKYNASAVIPSYDQDTGVLKFTY